MSGYTVLRPVVTIFVLHAQLLVECDTDCTARQCLPLRRKFMECSINNPALSLLMKHLKHLVIGQRQKAPNFSAFHWSEHGSLVSIGQHFVTTRVVHLPKRTETSLITESDQSRASHQLLQLCTVRTAWSNTDQAVRVVHSCKSWFENFVKNAPPPPKKKKKKKKKKRISKWKMDRFKSQSRWQVNNFP